MLCLNYISREVVQSETKQVSHTKVQHQFDVFLSRLCLAAHCLLVRFPVNLFAFLLLMELIIFNILYHYTNLFLPCFKFSDTFKLVFSLLYPTAVVLLSAIFGNEMSLLEV